jgi:hypothetical protein
VLFGLIFLSMYIKMVSMSAMTNLKIYFETAIAAAVEKSSCPASTQTKV